MSLSLKNPVEWWVKFFSLASAVKMSVEKRTGETVCAWTDACGDGGALAAVVFSHDNWCCAALVVPDSVTSQLLHRDDTQINFLEMLAVVLLVKIFGSFLSGKASSTRMASLVP